MKKKKITDKEEILATFIFLGEDIEYDEYEDSVTFHGNKKMFFDSKTGEIARIVETIEVDGKKVNKLYVG